QNTQDLNSVNILTHSNVTIIPYTTPFRSRGIELAERDRLRPRDLARERRQVPQRAGVDAALEGHHVLHRIPEVHPAPVVELGLGDLKSTRLNSSHVKISYSVFCLRNKNNK